MIKKESRSAIRIKKHLEFVTVLAALLKDQDLLYSEVIIICTLRLLTIQLVTL